MAWQPTSSVYITAWKQVTSQRQALTTANYKLLWKLAEPSFYESALFYKRKPDIDGTVLFDIRKMSAVISADRHADKRRGRITACRYNNAYLIYECNFYQKLSCRMTYFIPSFQFLSWTGCFVQKRQQYEWESPRCSKLFIIRSFFATAQLPRLNYTEGQLKFRQNRMAVKQSKLLGQSHGRFGRYVAIMPCYSAWTRHQLNSLTGGGGGMPVWRATRQTQKGLADYYLTKIWN